MIGNDSLISWHCSDDVRMVRELISMNGYNLRPGQVVPTPKEFVESSEYPMTDQGFESIMALGRNALKRMRAMDRLFS
eukprot:2524476-Rhodomonas_salina.1